MAGKLKFPLILASRSPRRQELLRAGGYTFRVVRPPVHELGIRADGGVGAAAWAEALAYFKARAVAAGEPGAIVVGADTLVARGRTIIGKPRDEADARRMLSTMLAGRNEVITGLAVLGPGPEQRVITHVTSVVMLRAMEPAEVETYLASGAWRDKAGAYALQEGGDRLVEKIEGSRSNVVGLPMERLAEILAPFEVTS